MFVHAGIKTDGSFTDSSYKLWAREEYWWQDKDSDKEIFAHNYTKKTIITGHTPTCFIYGSFNPQPDNMPMKINEDLQEYKCPVIKIQYDNEPARYFTDNGCHGKMDGHNGNVCVFNESGELVEVFS